MFYNRDMVRNLIKEYADRIKESDNKSIETELMYLLYECELERIKWDTPVSYTHLTLPTNREV